MPDTKLKAGLDTSFLYQKQNKLNLFSFVYIHVHIWAYQDMVKLQHVSNMTQFLCGDLGVDILFKTLEGGVAKLQRNRCHRTILEWIHSPQSTRRNLTEYIPPL